MEEGLSQNEIVQWTVVSVIVLIALIFAALKVIRMGKKSSQSHVCDCCDSSDRCKVRDLKISSAKAQKLKAENCRGGQSARN